MERIEITGVGSELQGVGRLADGRAAFVPGALIGEVVEVEPVRQAKRFCEARLMRVVQASPERTAPACPHYGRCGGCDALHMRYAHSLELKRRCVYDALVRLGGATNPDVRPTLGCAQPQRYRNKAEYAVEGAGEGLIAGCTAARSHRVIPVEDCLLQKPESLRALHALRAALPGVSGAERLKYIVTRVNRSGELAVTLSGEAMSQAALRALAEKMRAGLPELRSLHFCRLRPRPAHALDGACTRVWGADALTDVLLGLEFALSPQSFFQVNPPQAEALFRAALDAVEAGPGRRVLDAYCGAGAVALAAAARGAEALGVEIVAPAIENARRNAERNGLTERARFICGDATREVPQLVAQGERFDAAVVDPPRRGADEPLLRALAEADIPQIAYISCNPATLARDTKRLATLGYRLQWAQPVDMFPWTRHVETVVLLSKGEVDSKKIRVEFSLEDMDMSEFQDGATYPQIKEYVLEHTGLKVSNLYISQIKRKCGIEVGKNYNLPKSEDSRQPQCPPEKEKAIREAFKYFGMI